jgi:hypothetical protein
MGDPNNDLLRDGGGGDGDGITDNTTQITIQNMGWVWSDYESHASSSQSESQG